MYFKVEKIWKIHRYEYAYVKRNKKNKSFGLKRVKMVIKKIRNDIVNALLNMIKKFQSISPCIWSTFRVIDLHDLSVL